MPLARKTDFESALSSASPNARGEEPVYAIPNSSYIAATFISSFDWPRMDSQQLKITSGRSVERKEHKRRVSSFGAEDGDLMSVIFKCACNRAHLLDDAKFGRVYKFTGGRVIIRIRPAQPVILGSRIARLIIDYRDFQ